MAFPGRTSGVRGEFKEKEHCMTQTGLSPVLADVLVTAIDTLLPPVGNLS